MVEKIVPHAEAVCMDCEEGIQGDITVSADDFDLRQGVFSVDGGLIDQCKQHHGTHRWGKSADAIQHREFVLQNQDDETLIGTVTVSTEGSRFTILSLNAAIRSALTGE